MQRIGLEQIHRVLKRKEIRCDKTKIKKVQILGFKLYLSIEKRDFQRNYLFKKYFNKDAFFKFIQNL